MNKHLQYLKDCTLLLNPKDQHLVNVVLDDPRFIIWPGSCDKHHAHEGGLVEHTAEVFAGCMFAAGQAKVDIDIDVLKIAAIWHDYGKLWDYERNPNFPIDGQGRCIAPPEKKDWPWIKTSAGINIRHLSRSYAEFVQATVRLEISNNTMLEKISHCILSHHGRLEWGSPVEPKTPEAWALHLSDMMSVQCLARVKSPNKHP